MGKFPSLMSCPGLVVPEPNTNAVPDFKQKLDYNLTKISSKSSLTCTTCHVMMFQAGCHLCSPLRRPCLGHHQSRSRSPVCVKLSSGKHQTWTHCFNKYSQNMWIKLIFCLREKVKGSNDLQPFVTSDNCLLYAGLTHSVSYQVTGCFK